MIYTYSRTVTKDEIDFNNHVAYEMHLRYAKEAEIEFRETIGITQEKVEKTSLVLNAIHTECRYKNELFLDDKIDVLIELKNIGNSSLTYNFQICRNGEEMSYGNTTTVFVDIKKRVKAQIPEEFRKYLETTLAE